jgi:hypothetical protein
MRFLSNTELEQLTTTKYKITSFATNDNSIKNNLDSIISFDTNGDIRSSDKVIGKWNSDRSLSLTAFDKCFFIASFSKHYITLQTRYFTKTDEVISLVTIKFMDVNYKTVESESEFNW